MTRKKPRKLMRPSFASVLAKPNKPKPEAKTVANIVEPKPVPVSEPVPVPEEEPLEEYVEEPDEAPAAAPAETGPASAVTTEFGDFPYPWYITKVRQSLWDQWAKKTPGKGECEVSFSIRRNGQIVDLRVTYTSGDSTFDYAVLSAIQDAAPFAPLPPKFTEPFLKITVELKTTK